MDSVLGISLLDVDDEVHIEIQEEILSPRSSLSSVRDLQQQDQIREDFSKWLTSMKQTSMKLAPDEGRRINRIEGTIVPLTILFSPQNLEIGTY